MLFSIVIPVYNVEKYLDECLNTLLPQVQVYKGDAEILLIDDGSTDSSAKLCDQYLVAYPEIIKVFHKKNQGLLLTRRYGFKRASGEYIISCDSDDFVENDMLEVLNKAIKQYQPDVMIFNEYIYKGRKKEIFYENVFSNESIAQIGKQCVLEYFFVSHRPIVTSMHGKVFRRCLLDQDFDYTRFSKLSYGEDTLQTAEIFTKASSFLYINRPLYDYRIGSGMTARYDKSYYLQFKEVLLEVECYRPLWGLDRFNLFYLAKYYNMVARSVTQSMANKKMSYIERKEFLKSIVDDEMYQKNLGHEARVKQYLKKGYFIILWLLQKKMFWIIHIILKIKSMH